MHTTEVTAEHYTATLENGEEVTSNVPFHVTHVTPMDDFKLTVKFIDGTTGNVEMREMLFDRAAGVFVALRDEQVFAAVGVEDGAVVWKNGLDLAPDAMYDEIKRNGVWVLR